jgi:hypothetical protein
MPRLNEGTLQVCIEGRWYDLGRLREVEFRHERPLDEMLTLGGRATVLPLMPSNSIHVTTELGGPPPGRMHHGELQWVLQQPTHKGGHSMRIEFDGIAGACSVRMAPVEPETYKLPNGQRLVPEEWDPNGVPTMDLEVHVVGEPLVTWTEA